MPKMLRKIDFPQKKCVVCARPFKWRRKWSRVWKDVKFCSQKCRSMAHCH